MAQRPDQNLDLLKLTFLRELVRAAPDPQAESFPLMELAAAIVNSAMTPAMLLQRAGLSDAR